MSTDAEKLAHIAALCNGADEIAGENDPPRMYGYVGTPTLRRVLAEEAS